MDERQGVPDDPWAGLSEAQVAKMVRTTAKRVRAMADQGEFVFRETPLGRLYDPVSVEHVVSGRREVERKLKLAREEERRRRETEKRKTERKHRLRARAFDGVHPDKLTEKEFQGLLSEVGKYERSGLDWAAARIKRWDGRVQIIIGEVEPTLRAARSRRNYDKHRTEKTCPVCGLTFWGGPPQVFCTPTCRTRARRRTMDENPIDDWEFPPDLA